MKTRLRTGLPSSKEDAASPQSHFLIEETDAGLVGGCTRTPPKLNTMSNAMGGIPPYPGNSVVAPASVPEPVKLRADDHEEYMVKLLAQCLRGAVEKQYGTKCFLLAKISPKANHWRTLAKAAVTLRSYDVAPAAWCIYAVRRWYRARTHTGGWKEGMPVQLPPVGVVFSTKMMDEKLSDEDRRHTVSEHAVGGRVVFGKLHKTLLRRYGEMRSAILRGVPKAQAVAEFFPGTAYQELVDAAITESVEIRARLEDDVRRGKDVW